MKPRWRWLYAILTTLLGVLGLIEAGMPPGPARQALEVVMAVVIFGAMAVWVRLNRVPVMAAGDRRAPIRRVAAVRHVDEAAPAATGTAPTSGAVQAIWPS